MATASITWGACGSASDGTYLYYGKSLVVTGTPISGTGWTLYTGAPLANTANSASITGLDDNVEYVFYVYCHCASSGNGPLVNQGPLIKYVCPSVSIPSKTNSTINYSLTVPAAANNSGSWIQTIVVTLFDSSNTQVISKNTHNSPFSGTINGSFTGLSASTTYNLQVKYSNAGEAKNSICSSQSIVTNAACVAPSISTSNVTSISFDVSFSPITAGDTFDIIVNGNTVATGITVSPYTVTGLTANTSYTVAVRRNCVTGGNAISSNSNVTTLAIPDPPTSTLTFANYQSGQFTFTLTNAINSTSIVINGATVNGSNSVNCTGGVQANDTLDSGHLVAIAAGSLTASQTGATPMGCGIGSYIKVNNISILGKGTFANGNTLTVGGTTVTVSIAPICNTYTC
jgi:hypothetical protein